MAVEKLHNYLLTHDDQYQPEQGTSEWKILTEAQWLRETQKLERQRKLKRKKLRELYNQRINTAPNQFIVDMCDLIEPDTKGPFDNKCLSNLWFNARCTRKGAYYFMFNPRIAQYLNNMTWYQVTKYIQLLAESAKQGSQFAQQACVKQS